MPGLFARYEQLIANGELRADADQQAAALRLDALQAALEATPSAGLFGQLFGKKSVPPRGVYMWGGVGRGKSMLMDLFHDTLDVRGKRRAHFHAFMQEVHARLKQARKTEQGDPVLAVAADIARDLKCLAFDEMVVNNSADAMIMSRLFTQLVKEEGVVIVTTSNRPPSDLYLHGISRDLFLPFIALIEAEIDILGLNGPTDYRLDRISGLDTWHTPLGDAATAKVREAFFRLTDFAPEDAEHVPSEELDVGGNRVLHVPKSLKGVGVFSFKRLCGEARGAPDYLALAQHFHTVILVGIPQMDAAMRNEAARFVTLIDALYEHKVKLFATANAEPEALYVSGDGSFEFERTASRLREMQSEDYLALGHGAA